MGGLHIHVHMHSHPDEDTKKFMRDMLETQQTIINKLNQMANELQDLTAEVSETKGIMASAKVLIEGFAQKLEEAGTDKAKLTALKDELNAGSEDLATAIAANPLPTENVEPTPPADGGTPA